MERENLLQCSETPLLDNILPVHLLQYFHPHVCLGLQCWPPFRFRMKFYAFVLYRHSFFSFFISLFLANHFNSSADFKFLSLFLLLLLFYFRSSDFTLSISAFFLSLAIGSKRKSTSVTGRGAPQACETSRLQHFVDNRVTYASEVVRLTRRLPFTPRKIPGIHFC
jgi:hypothetical protein